MSYQGSQPAAVLVFARKPVPGRVKTRLAADIGDEAACEVYRELLEHTLAVVGATAVTRYLYEADGARMAHLGLAVAGFEERAQIGEDLGARLENAFAEAFAEGHRRVVCVGSDCPGLTPALLHEALEALERHDCVFGPALDGGYYLVGQRPADQDLFSDIPWSTDQVWPRTRARLDAQGISYAVLLPLEDIDDFRSLARWRARQDEAVEP